MTMRCTNFVSACFILALPAAGLGDAHQLERSATAPTAYIDVATAAVVAQRHLAHSGAADSFGVTGIQMVRDAADSAVLCYCFDLAPAGYVIVAADAALPPVVAYSFTSPAPCDLASGTPMVDLLRWDLGRRLAHAELVREDVAREIRDAWVTKLTPTPTAGGRAFEQWPPAGTTPTGGWLEETWTQNAPYNNLCPMDLAAGARSVAGCPSVAMAQILDYHGRLNATNFDDGDDYYHNYGSNRFWIDDAYVARDFPSFPQLNTHLDALFDDYFHGATPSDTHRAALVFACGVAARQVYSSSGSGTFGVSQALDAYQKFNCETATLLDDSDPNVYSRLAQNMIAARPAHLAVVDPGWSYGHNLVVDGYNTDGYFHLNFGWGGSYNGWYIIPSGMPYGLTVLEGLVLDIMTMPCAALDCTCDGSVNLQDFAYYEGCLSGPMSPFVSPGCVAFDADDDTDVDLLDFGLFQVAFDG